MIEHNNRKIADVHAEFITSKQLRKLVADKVSEYLGNSPVSVFDGAVGSGQMEEYVNIKHLTGVDIQPEAIRALESNFGGKCVGIVGDFLDLDVDGEFDCVVMNPPFSLKCRGPVERMPYAKKNGVLDECFYVLSSMKARFSFFVCFPGIGYRRSEQKMREYFGNSVIELITVEDGFDDTAIDVLFVIIDREKADTSVLVSRYSCKKGSYVIEPRVETLDIGNWNQAKVIAPKEKTNIVRLTSEVQRLSAKNRAVLDEFDALVLSLMTDRQLRRLKAIRGEK